MRHMGNSGKIALIAAVAALGMLVLTAITLEEAVMVSFLGLVALAYLAAVGEVFIRGRRFVLVATGIGSSLTVAFSLAFLSTWELAFVDQATFLGTPLPADDPDDYFFWAAASAIATLLVLFLGAVWPAGRPLGTARRKPSPSSRRPAAAARRPSSQSTAARKAAGQRASGSRAPARLPAAAAKRPSSSASAGTSRVRTPAPKSAAKAAPPSGASSAARR